MKKLSLIMAVMMVITAFTAVIAVPTTAATAVFEVNGTQYDNYTDAYAAAAANTTDTTIKILSDFTIATGDSTLRVREDITEKCNITIDGQGYTITDNFDNGGYGVRLTPGSTYTVTLKNVTINTNGFVQCSAGKSVFDNVKIYSKNTNASLGAVLFNSNANLTIEGGSYIESNPDYATNAYNSTNPVFRLNAGEKNFTVNVYDATIVAYNSLFLGAGGASGKGTTCGNAVFNIYDGADIKTAANAYETANSGDESILFSAEWLDLEFNMYGGTLTSATTALHYASATGKGSVANVYGGTVNGYINVDANYTDVNIYGGTFVRNAKDTWTSISDVVSADANVYGGKFTNYAGTYDLSTGLEYDPAASIRTSNDTTGIRFTSTISADMLTNVELLDDDGIYKIGTIIVPYSYLGLMEKAELTHDALKAAYLPYLDIEAVNSRVKNADGSYTIKAAITNIKETNLETEFIATAYISFEDAAGNKYTIYSNALPSADDARSAEYVAVMALSDCKEAAEGTYVNAVHTMATYTGTGETVSYTVTKNDENNTWYSKYTDQECKNIAALIPGTTGECDAKK